MKIGVKRVMVLPIIKKGKGNSRSLTKTLIKEMEEIMDLTGTIDRKAPITDSKSFLISSASILECAAMRGTS